MYGNNKQKARRPLAVLACCLAVLVFRSRSVLPSVLVAVGCGLSCCPRTVRTLSNRPHMIHAERSRLTAHGLRSNRPHLIQNTHDNTRQRTANNTQKATTKTTTTRHAKQRTQHTQRQARTDRQSKEQTRQRTSPNKARKDRQGNTHKARTLEHSHGVRCAPLQNTHKAEKGIKHYIYLYLNKIKQSPTKTAI